MSASIHTTVKDLIQKPLESVGFGSEIDAIFKTSIWLTLSFLFHTPNTFHLHKERQKLIWRWATSYRTYKVQISFINANTKKKKFSELWIWHTETDSSHYIKEEQYVSAVIAS